MSVKRCLTIACLLCFVPSLIACSSETSPVFIPQVRKTSATQTSLPVQDFLSDFPLTPGSYWVYSHSEYQEQQVDAGRVTVSVVENQMLGSHFLAHMEVEQSFATQWVPVGLGSGAGDFWYAIDPQGSVYALEDLPETEDFTHSTLAYRFPLESSECWFRSADLWNALGENCTYSDGPQALETPAGLFEGCFAVITPYLSGATLDWVCKGVGYTGARYDHLGSPFGYETTLLEYKIADP